MALSPESATRDRALYERVEAGTVAYRTKMAYGSIDDVRASEQALQHLLD